MKKSVKKDYHRRHSAMMYGNGSILLSAGKKGKVLLETIAGGRKNRFLPLLHVQRHHFGQAVDGAVHGRDQKCQVGAHRWVQFGGLKF
jgi:hypothetical protein